MLVSRRILIYFFVLFFSTPLFAQTQWSLEQCILYAQEHNITIKQSALNVQLSEQTNLQAKLNLLPTLNGSTNYGFSFGKNIDPTSNTFITSNYQSASFSVSTGVTLFNGLQKENGIKQAEFNLLAAQSNFQKIKNDISLSIAAAFLQVLYAKENLNNMQSQKNLLAAQLDKTKILVVANILAEGNQFDMEAQVAQQNLNEVTAKNSLDLAKLNLSQLLDLDSTIDIATPMLTFTKDMLFSGSLSVGAIYQTALISQPQIQASQYSLFAAQKGLNIAKGRLYPSLSFYGSVSTNYSNAVKKINSVDTSGFHTIGFVQSTNELVLSPSFTYSFVKTPFGDQFKDNFGQSVGFSLSIPIFDAWNAHTGVESAKINFLNAQYNYELVQNQLKKDVQTAYADAVAGKDKYNAALANETAIEKSFNNAKQKFDLGAISSVDFNVAQNNLVQAQSQVLQAKYDYIFKLKILDFYQGKPLTL